MVERIIEKVRELGDIVERRKSVADSRDDVTTHERKQLQGFAKFLQEFYRRKHE